MKLSRRELLAGAGVALLPEAAFAQGRGPNVVLVIIDSLRVDHVGAYGGRKARTPNLDAFAKQSMLFTQAHPESMPTVPARRAMMTGKRSYPFRRWRSYENQGLSGGPGSQPIKSREVSFHEVLGRAGYRTAYVTDNPHILSRPYDRFRRSFDFRREIKGQTPVRRHPRKKIGNRELSRWWPRELRKQPGKGRLREYITLNKHRRKASDYMPAQVFRAGEEFLQRQAGSNRPFALVVDSFDAHEPWDPPIEYLRMYAKGARRGPQPIQPFKTPSGFAHRLRRRTLRRAQDLYAAEVTFVDACFGKLMRRLEATGQADDTWVIVLSDHGVMLGERNIIGKSHSNLYRELTHVPFMIRHPKRAKAGHKSDYYASTHDVATTILGAAGLRKPRAMTGADLTAFFRGKAPKKRGYWTSALKDHVCVGDKRWLLICNFQGREAKLFDRRRDPGERRNVARRNRRRVRRMFRKALRDAGGRRLPRF